MTPPVDQPDAAGHEVPADDAATRWEAQQRLLQDAIERAPAEREAYLSSACPDPSQRAQVEALLQGHDGRGPLDDLADRVMAPLLAARPRATGTTPPASHTRYRILERLGGGGMGVVYRARDERLERDIALKFLPPHLSDEPSAKRRFLVEARAAAALEHPNICTVHEIGETDDGQLYIVMACYDGETLDRRIARGPLPVDEAMRLAAEIARGLAKAHERGIVHRDIKPANVVVTADGLVKILDFGIAKLADVTATRTVGVVGTLAYMSPEQAFGEEVDHRTDIWSLGVVLYEMLAGVRPFRGTGEQGLLFNALTADPEPLRDQRPEVPAQLDSVIRRALAKSPAERFASAPEFIAALASCPSEPLSTGERTNRPATTTEPADEPRDTALTRGGERRQVTVVCTSIAGADTLIERMSPEESDAIVARLRDAALAAATRQGGVLNQFSSDRCVMLFGVPTAREDDTVRALRAALALHAHTRDVAAALDPRWSGELHARSGVHVGSVVAQRVRTGDAQYRVTGTPMDVAARLADAAAAHAVLLSPEVRRLAAPYMHSAPDAPLALRTGSAPVVPHRLLGLTEARSRLEGRLQGTLTPFVGRERERRALGEHLAAAAAGEGRLTVLVGEAGAGKSRLLHELREAATSAVAQVFLGRCDAHGGGTAFLPFVEAVHEALELPRGLTAQQRHDAAVAATRAIDPSLEEYTPLYLALLAIPSSTHPVPEHLKGDAFQAAMLEAIAALFTVGARARPTVLLLEDWHWADEASRTALRQLAEVVPAYPLLLVVTSRPDQSMDWGSHDHQVVLHLSPLDVAASARIAGVVFGAASVAPDLVTQLHERTGGNPFFLEELCEALHEDGAVAVRDGVAIVARAGAEVHVPETVQGVLRTRIDRLDAEARDALRVAAVIGRDFSRGILEDVVEASGDLARSLERLKASGLVQQVSVAPEPAFRFKHVLTQEVAYDSLLEHQRVTLHAAVGRAIEHRYATQLDKHVERLAFHFSRAESWSQAVRYGMQSADRSAALGQNADALHTLERAESWVLRLPDTAARRDLHADLLLRLERLCETMGLRNRQLAIVEALITLLAPHGPSERLAQAYLRQGDAYTLLRRFESAERSLETALQIARDRTDAAGERNALRSIAFLRSHEGRHHEALARIEEVLALGRAAGDRRAEAGDLATVANILRAMGQQARALAVLEEALERTEQAENPFRYGALLNVIGTVHRELGNYDEALHYYRRTSNLLLHPIHTAFTLPAVAFVQLQQGKVDEALATYREAAELCRRTRYADGSAQVCRSLGEVLVGLDRFGEALGYLREGAALFAQLEDRDNEALMWRRAASVHERLGEHAEALEVWMHVRTLSQDAGDLPGELEAIEGMARCERQRGDRTEYVVTRYQEALALAARLGDRKRELSLRNSLGIVEWQRGRYAEAVRQYEAALRLCRDGHDRVHEGLILNSLGASLHKLQRWDEARTVLSDSVRVTAQAGELQLQAHALATLGEVALASGRLDEARANVERSLALRRELGDRRGEGWMLERLARVQLASGAPDAARASADGAASIAQDVGDAALHDAVQRLSLPTGHDHTSHP